MRSPSTRHLSIKISGTASHYLLQLSSCNKSYGGQISKPLKLEKLDELVKDIDKLAMKKPDKRPLAREFGGLLFQTVFDRKAADFLREVTATASTDTPLQLRFSFEKAEELARLPWEYLYDPANERFLALQAGISLGRHPQVRLNNKLPHSTSKLKLLIVAATPLDKPKIKVDKEVRAIRRAFDFIRESLTITLLENTQLEHLENELSTNTYQLLHFIGHNIFPDDDPTGAIILETPERLTHIINAKQLADLLGKHPTLQLVLLNTCRAAKTIGDGGLINITSTLLQTGLPAIVSMQFNLSEKVAIKLAGSFYQKLADGHSIDKALTLARIDLHDAWKHLEWGVPVLHLHEGHGNLFGPSFTPRWQNRKKLSYQFTVLSERGWEHTLWFLNLVYICLGLSSITDGINYMRKRINAT